jgi:methionine-rich copper-binding protein CopC
MGRRWVRASACVGVALSLAFIGAAPVAAHAQLVSATPAPGSTVSSPPSEVRLTFDGPPYDYGLGVVVLSPSGGHLETGRVSVEGNDVVQPVRGSTGSGTITVRWRVVSADGHPASGQYTFVLDANGRSAAAGAAQDPSSPGSGTGWLLLLVVALAVIGLVTLLLMSGRRRSDLARPDGPSA